VGILIGLTYLFTRFLADPGQPPDLVRQDAGALPGKTEVVWTEVLQPLSSAGKVDRGAETVGITNERAPEQITTEKTKLSTLPVSPTSFAPAAAPVPEPSSKPRPVGSIPADIPAKAATADTITFGATTSPSSADRGGSPQEQLYKAVCQACHDVDGKGGNIRKLMPQIPDFTDSRWQRSRTDVELVHSVTKGKGQLMLPMKDKLSEARIEPQEMVAFVRAFSPSALVTAPTASPLRTQMP